MLENDKEKSYIYLSEIIYILLKHGIFLLSTNLNKLTCKVSKNGKLDFYRYIILVNDV